MSHSNARVRFADGLVLHAEYNGTCDVLLPRLWDTEDEMLAHWRQEAPDEAYQQDAHVLEEVEIAVTYGGGYWWRGQACRICRTVATASLEPKFTFEVGNANAGDGLPPWFVGLEG